jgi:predicted AlkP superfamily phosphohydrolase/phosphomutase
MLTGWLYGLVYINREGREKEGVISPGEPYEKLRELIAERLSSLSDVQTGKKVIRNVYKREELFQGRFVENAPDLIVVPEEGYEFNQSFIENPEEIFKSNVLQKDHTGIHDQDGIFILHGDDLAKKTTVEQMNIVDIFPFILYYMGVDIPAYTDGKVLSGLFSESFIKDNPIRYTDLVAGPKEKPELEAFSEEDKDKIEKRLKDLGYM